MVHKVRKLLLFLGSLNLARIVLRLAYQVNLNQELTFLLGICFLGSLLVLTVDEERLGDDVDTHTESIDTEVVLLLVTRLSGRTSTSVALSAGVT